MYMNKIVKKKKIENIETKCPYVNNLGPSLYG
jgi:hypothetical protein